MKRFIGFLMMVLFIGAFTGFGNTITDLAKDSVKSDHVFDNNDVVTICVLDFKMVESFVNDVGKINSDVDMQILNKIPYSQFEATDTFNKKGKSIISKARDKLSC